MPLIRLYDTSQLGVFYVQLYGDNTSASFRGKSDNMNFVIYSCIDFYKCQRISHPVREPGAIGGEPITV
jgi:hypothetical protein